MLISETFVSRQGEGKLTGTESFFIRTSGCNLRCWFCDTPYASWQPSGERISVSDLVQAVIEAGHSHVVLTGGEPLVAAECESLCDDLMGAGAHLTIETAGTVDKPIACDLLSLSPKLASSTPDANKHPQWSKRHEERRLPIPVMKKLIEKAADFQVKFVVESQSQQREVDSVVNELGVTPEHVFLMPQGTSVAEMDAAVDWLNAWCLEAGYRYCDRMQIRWYGNRRGT
ncbi:MAG: 7-carboxy-7-deazaguanine synthase QueE [Planctomycetota bacterium]